MAQTPSRRRLLRGLAATALPHCLTRNNSHLPADARSQKPIRSTGEDLPAIGLGSWMVVAISELGSTFGQSNLASEIVWFR
jgi:hypothetical protein